MIFRENNKKANYSLGFSSMRRIFTRVPVLEPKTRRIVRIESMVFPDFHIIEPMSD